MVVLTVLAAGNAVLLITVLVRTKKAPPDPGLERLRTDLLRLEQALPEQLRAQREESSHAASQLRHEIASSLHTGFERLDRIRDTVDKKLGEIQSRNEQKLEEMRRTVDEKLQSTLERRLGESFKLVSERLEQVHKGLGEMQAIAASVGDLKRVLTNVKARGTWGEIQLGALLEEVLTAEQFARNVETVPRSGERVEFALRLPGQQGDGPIWLPIDAKFPQEDYQRLVEASERGDAIAVIDAGKAFETRIRAQAKVIREKYISAPHTTDFGIMFMASEGLYAEVLRRPGLADAVQREARILISGPTTLAAFLNSLQIGFRTLAIQERASEVWKVLSAVKTEFEKFGGVLSQVKKKLNEASDQIEQTEVRTRAISRKLRDVEVLPAAVPEDNGEDLALPNPPQSEQNSLGI
jgi:DNA recombination protein RmuC